MYEAMMMAATGLVNQQRRIDTIADNMANSSTVGFKSSRLDFKDALYTAGFSPAPAYSPGEDQQKGHGVMVSAVTREHFKDGNIQVTDQELDLAITGDGFFQLADAAGRVLYTRAGNFYASTEENATYLVNANGYYVQNIHGQPIEIPRGADSVSVSPDGHISFSVGGETSGDTIGIYTFVNRAGLLSTGGSSFEATEASGDPVEASVTVRQGALESSNVDMAEEMTRLIRAQRAFSLAARALTTADNMEGIANNLKK